MSIIAQLKKKGSDVSKLTNRLVELKNNQGGKQDEYWKLSVDSSGKGSAIIRLLPEAEGEDYPFVKVNEYFINGPVNATTGKKKYYVHRSLETIGHQDPAKEEFWACHNLKTPEGKEMAKTLREGTTYIVWIYIVKDQIKPENNGRVVKAKLSPSIWKHVENALSPEFEGDQAIKVFNLFEGANFEIRAKNDTNNMRTYEQSKFHAPSVLFDDEAKLEEIYSQVKGLECEIDPNNVALYGVNPEKEFTERKKHLRDVLQRDLLQDNEGVQSLNESLDEAIGNTPKTVSTEKSNSEESDEDARLRALLNDD